MNNRKIKNGLKVLLAAGLISGCATKENSNCGRWVLGYSNDGNWSRQVIICDSLQMINEESAFVFINGIKSKVFAEQFFPMYEPCR